MCISECTQAPRHLLLAQEWFGLPVCHQSPNWSCLAAERALFALLCCSHSVLLVADHLVAMAFLLESYSWKFYSLAIPSMSPMPNEPMVMSSYLALEMLKTTMNGVPLLLIALEKRYLRQLQTDASTNLSTMLNSLKIHSTTPIISSALPISRLSI